MLDMCGTRNLDEIKEMHIKGLSINWDRISRESYLRDILAISKITEMVFDTPITFFAPYT